MEMATIIVFKVIGFFVLFLIIAFAVKLAVREALNDFKEDLIEEFGLKRVNEIVKDLKN